MKRSIVFLATAVIASLSHAQSGNSGEGCSAYPYSDGINVEAVDGGTKILATGSASVSFDDVDSIRDAREEAEMEAKAAISKFLSEGIKSDSVISKTVKESRSTTAEGRKADRNELIERVKVLRNSTQALLRGVVPLGDCYTKGREVRVSVGIKPETINAAGNLSGSMSKSLSSQPTPSATAGNGAGGGGAQGSGPGTGETHRGMPGWSNTQRLKNF